MRGWVRSDRRASQAPAWYVADVLLAVALGYLTVSTITSDTYDVDYGTVSGARWIIVLGPIAMVALRRAAPLAVYVLGVLAYVATAFDQGGGNELLALPFLVYTVASTRPPARAGLIVAVGAVAVSAGGLHGPPDPVDFYTPTVWLLAVIGWTAGVRARRAQVRAAALAGEAAQARLDAAATAREAVAHERARIARELHDAVGHAVNVIVLRAGAARFLSAEDHSTATLRDIERIGRAALGDLDRMLGLLDGGLDEPAPRSPSQGLADIAVLIEGVRGTGLEATLVDECGDRVDTTVERQIGAAAYRVVQEALTNTVKHAGPARVEVRLRCDDNDLVVDVVDDGRGAAAGPATTGGRGLTGMRERVHVLGGTFQAGPRPGGGYRVHARLPRLKER